MPRWAPHATRCRPRYLSFSLSPRSQVCDSSHEGVMLLVAAFKEILSRDRAHLVPVVGALGALRLPDKIWAP